MIDSNTEILKRIENKLQNKKEDSQKVQNDNQINNNM